MIITVNENIKKICVDPRYQANSKAQLLVRDILNQVIGKGKRLYIMITFRW